MLLSQKIQGTSKSPKISLRRIFKLLYKFKRFECGEESFAICFRDHKDLANNIDEIVKVFKRYHCVVDFEYRKRSMLFNLKQWVNNICATYIVVEVMKNGDIFVSFHNHSCLSEIIFREVDIVEFRQFFK